MSSGQAILGLWSIILEPGKTLSQNVAPGIQITNISFGAEVTGSDRCVVSMRYPEFQNDSDDEDEDEEDEEDSDEDGDDIKLPKLITKEAVIAILRPDFTEQVSVNITLVDDVEVVEFSVTGPNAVHLVGHYCRQEDFDQEPFSDSDDENPYGDSDDEEIDSDFEGDYDMEEGTSGMLGEDDDEEDSETEERFVELAAAIPSKKRTADADVSVDVTADESMTSTMSKNQKKKLAKKMKATDGSAVEAVVAAAAPVAKKAAVVVAPVAAAAAKKEAVVAPVEKKAGKSAPVTLAGGLIIHDAKKGEGAIAKSGKKVSMRYIGKLDNGKIFDSNTKGSPLSFTLGRGEVIKGWDNGIIGMAVGGERKLTIPAALAYGKKGTQGIPGNSTLTFDVKLISIK